MLGELLHDLLGELVGVQERSHELPLVFVLDGDAHRADVGNVDLAVDPFLPLVFQSRHDATEDLTGAQLGVVVARAEESLVPRAEPAVHLLQHIHRAVSPLATVSIAISPKRRV